MSLKICWCQWDCGKISWASCGMWSSPEQINYAFPAHSFLAKNEGMPPSLCGKPHLLVIRWVSEIIKTKKEKQLEHHCDGNVHPWLRADPFIFNPTMTLLSWVFKWWSAAGGRQSWGASCSCGNVCCRTMERAEFSQSPAPRIQPEKGGPHTTTITVRRYHLMKKSPLEGK